MGRATAGDKVMIRIRAFRSFAAAIVSICLLPIAYGANDGGLPSLLSAYMEGVHEPDTGKQSTTVKYTDFIEYYRNPHELLKAVQPYEMDASSQVRRHAYHFLWKAAKDSDDIEVRQEVVARLAQGLNDPNEGIVGSVKENYLNYFGEADY
ncbi:MAG: hypothetical protein GY820_15710, partial [Gammaproteobacteria bacterium]|nr:hypothetical protein [Gammaproteobacteria bacterium]